MWQGKGWRKRVWQCQGRNWDDNYVGSEGHKKFLVVWGVTHLLEKWNY